MSPEEFGKLCAQALEDKIQELGPENVAAFIGEPIQGAGGVIIPPATYWPEIQKICKKHDILLIADEVICGFGRTGHWFASEHFGIEADFMTLAKGITSGYMPLSAIMVATALLRMCSRRDGRLRAWLHLFGTSGGLRGGDREHPDHEGREAGRSRAQRDRPLSRQEDAGVPRPSAGRRGAATSA